jgi:hypothetical protein
VIPSSVEEIGDRCFYWCRYLCEVIFETGSRLREIGSKAFDGTSLSQIEIPSKCETLSGSSLVGVKSVTISRENPFFFVKRMMVMDKNDKKLIRYFGSESQVFIKREIEVIGEFCFCRCRSVCEVIFEEGSRLRQIEESAFDGSGLTKIRIPSSVEAIGQFCFYVCESLCEVTFEEASRLQRIQSWTFMSSGLTRISLPSSVKSIGRQALSLCKSLREVVFEGIVPDVGQDLLLQCPVELIKMPHGMSLTDHVLPDGCRIEYICTDSDEAERPKDGCCLIL